MARKKAIVRNETIIKSSMVEVMHDSMMPYAEYVVMERALPRVEDGLKPVQRRILYTMRELSNTPDKPHKKSARITGDTMGKYHPHGDTSIYEAMVRMAQPFSVREMLVDGHGNFGSIDGDRAAAMRYTEVRMTRLSLEMLRDIEKDTVPFSYNFDDTLKEPDGAEKMRSKMRASTPTREDRMPLSPSDTNAPQEGMDNEVIDKQEDTFSEQDSSSSDQDELQESMQQGMQMLKGLFGN